MARRSQHARFGGILSAAGAAIHNQFPLNRGDTQCAQKEAGGVRSSSLTALSCQLYLAIIAIFLARALIQGFPTDSAKAWVTRRTT